MEVILSRIKTIFQTTTAKFPDSQQYTTFLLMGRDEETLSGVILTDPESLKTEELYNLMFSVKPVAGIENDVSSSLL
jgi:hypothetical protein